MGTHAFVLMLQVVLHMQWATENSTVGFLIYETVFGTCVTHFAGGLGMRMGCLCSDAGRVVICAMLGAYKGLFVQHFFLSLAQQPNAGQGRLIIAVLASHTVTRHSR